MQQLSAQQVINERKGATMNAEELTKRYYEQRVKVNELSKTVEYLEQELSKLRMIVDDLKIDFQMERGGRRNDQI